MDCNAESEAEPLSSNAYGTSKEAPSNCGEAEAKPILGHWRSQKDAKKILDKKFHLCKLCGRSSSLWTSLSRHVAIKHKMSMKAYEKQDGNMEHDSKAGIAKEVEKNGQVATECSSEGTCDSTDGMNQRHLDDTEKCGVNLNEVERGPESDHKDDKVAQRKQKFLNTKNRREVENETSVSCVLCCKTFANFSRVKQHLVKQHSEDARFEHALKEFGKMKIQQTKQNVSDICLECVLCGESFFGMRLFSHLKAWHTDAENLAQVLKEAKQQYHFKRNAQQKSAGKNTLGKCRFCQKEMKSSSLHCHEKYRCKENKGRHKLFECSVCGFGSIFQEVYEEHMRSHPAGQKDYMCTACGKAFKTKSGLQMHCRKTHGMVRLYWDLLLLYNRHNYLYSIIIQGRSQTFSRRGSVFH